MKPAIKSKTMWWGHIQTALGAVAVVVPFITRDNFPNLPAWVYGTALVVGGLVTYVLRKLTTQPIGKPDA